MHISTNDCKTNTAEKHEFTVWISIPRILKIHLKCKERNFKSLQHQIKTQKKKKKPKKGIYYSWAKILITWELIDEPICRDGIGKKKKRRIRYLSLSGQNDRNANYGIIMYDLIKTFITPLTHHSWKIFLSYFNSTSCRFLHMNTHEKYRIPIKIFLSPKSCLFIQRSKKEKEKKNRQRRYPTTILFFPKVHLFLRENRKSTKILHTHTNRHTDIALLPSLSPSFLLAIQHKKQWLSSGMRLLLPLSLLLLLLLSLKQGPQHCTHLVSFKLADGKEIPEKYFKIKLAVETDHEFCFSF